MISRIVAAAHGQLAALCGAAGPGASVRIANPLASGAYADVSCASVLDGDGATGEASSALWDEPEDEEFDPENQGALGWSPIGVGCSLVVLGVGALTAEGCRQNYPSSKGCPWAATGGTFLINLALCQLV